MKTQDLRLGNYIMDSPINGDEPLEVNAIFDNLVIHEERHIYSDEIRPIPLTEEWLLIFGFEKNNSNFFLNKDSSVTHEKTGSESGFWYSNDESNAYCYRLKKIEYIHELQNLHFALTGEELK